MIVSSEYENLHAEAKTIFSGALKACDIPSSLDRRIRFEGDVLLRLGADGTTASSIDLNSVREVFVVAIGKAAGPMLDGLLTRMSRRTGVRGIYCSNQPSKAKYEHFQFFEGGHPLPNEESFAAARAALTLLKAAASDTLIFFLISGGASAMCELPLDPSITLEETICFHQLLIGSGATISEVNTLRKHFSAVKGGRMALAAPLAMKVNLLLPDVPLDSLDALASGPTFPNTSTLSDARELLDRYGLTPKLPQAVRRLLEHGAPDELPAAGKDWSLSISPTAREKESALLAGKYNVFQSSWFEVLLSTQDLVESAREIADNAGFYAVIDNSCDDWDYARAAEYLLKRFHQLRQRHPRLCLISGGEVTVTLNDHPGVGGRNQQFTLRCALELNPYRGERLVVLSAGSDGIDGNSDAAGAVADTTTVARASARGLDSEAALRAFDAYPLFAAIGDLVVTKPTGQNLRDLRLLIAES